MGGGGGGGGAGGGFGFQSNIDPEELFRYKNAKKNKPQLISKIKFLFAVIYTWLSGHND